MKVSQETKIICCNIALLGQSFKTTYVLRTQVFFRDQWNDRNTPAVSMQELCDFVNSSIVMD